MLSVSLNKTFLSLSRIIMLKGQPRPMVMDEWHQDRPKHLVPVDLGGHVPLDDDQP